MWVWRELAFSRHWYWLTNNRGGGYILMSYQNKWWSQRSQIIDFIKWLGMWDWSPNTSNIPSLSCHANGLEEEACCSLLSSAFFNPLANIFQKSEAWWTPRSHGIIGKLGSQCSLKQVPGSVLVSNSLLCWDFTSFHLNTQPSLDISCHDRDGWWLKWKLFTKCWWSNTPNLREHST